MNFDGIAGQVSIETGSSCIAIWLQWSVKVITGKDFLKTIKISDRVANLYI